MRNWLLAIFLISSPVWAGDEAKAPIADNPIVDVRGTIAKVQIAMGQGMPFLEVTTAQGPVKLYLGSMRYLIQENFTPKAGEALEAKGYKVNKESIVAIRIELPGTKKVLKLRDEHGWPLWMGGMRRGEHMSTVEK
jgi:hypothetical protein